MGRISQDWLTLQGSYTTTDDIYREPYVWASSIVEISLQKFMELWEQRNQDVHGKTEAQQQSRRLEKLRIEIRKLHSLRNQTRPSDDFIFHDDLEGFLEKTTATKAANYISSTKRIILHSITAAKKAAAARTQNILEWFKPVDPEGLNRIRKWRRDKLVHDAFSKKKKRKLKKKNAVVPIRYRQPSLTGYISLRQALT